MPMAAMTAVPGAGNLSRARSLRSLRLGPRAARPGTCMRFLFPSGEQVVDHVAVHVGQAHITAAKSKSEAGMVKAQ